MLIKESSKNSRLILMRHAARSFDDDQLSSEGLRQASTLQKTLEGRGLPAPITLESSPKKRTQSTLRFLAEELNVPVKIDPRLDERASHESVHAFEERVRSYCEAVFDRAVRNSAEIASTKFVHLACSHLDWLEAAALILPSDETEFERIEPWSPMAIRAYILSDGIWQRTRGPK